MTKRELEAENARLRSELEIARAGIERRKHSGSFMIEALCAPATFCRGVGLYVEA